MNQNVECQIETPEYKKETGFLVNDFLKAQEIQGANDIKEILRSKITETCNIQEIQDLRDDFSEKGQNLTGKEKFKMYELSAMLSNYLKEIRANPQLQTHRAPQPLGGDVYGELENQTQNFERNEAHYVPIEVLGGTITKNELGFTGKGLKMNKRERKYEIVAGDIIPRGGNKYEIVLFNTKESRHSGNNSTESIIIAYNGMRTITIFNDRENPIKTVLLNKSFYTENAPQNFTLRLEDKTIELKFVSSY